MGRHATRQTKALEILRNGAKTVPELARLIGISNYHSRSLVNVLRRQEQVRVIGMDGRSKLWALVSQFRRCDQWTPVIEQEYETAERDRWLAELLDKWARFMSSYWGPHGYPQRSAGMPARARIQSFEDLEEQVDRHLVEACDACIDSLPDKLRAAVYYRYNLTDRITGNPQEQVEDALELLIQRLKGRVVVP